MRPPSTPSSAGYATLGPVSSPIDAAVRTEEVLSPEQQAEIEERRAEIDAGEIGGVVLDPEDEEAHLAACEEIPEIERRGELVPAAQYIAASRAARAQTHRRAG